MGYRTGSVLTRIVAVAETIEAYRPYRTPRVAALPYRQRIGEGGEL